MAYVKLENGNGAAHTEGANGANGDAANSEPIDKR